MLSGRLVEIVSVDPTRKSAVVTIAALVLFMLCSVLSIMGVMMFQVLGCVSHLSLE